MVFMATKNIIFWLRNTYIGVGASWRSHIARNKTARLDKRGQATFHQVTLIKN